MSGLHPLRPLSLARLLEGNEETIIPKQLIIEMRREMKMDSCTEARTNGQFSMRSVRWVEPPLKRNNVIVQDFGRGCVGFQEGRVWEPM